MDTPISTSHQPIIVAADSDPSIPGTSIAYVEVSYTSEGICLELCQQPPLEELEKIKPVEIDGLQYVKFPVVFKAIIPGGSAINLNIHLAEQIKAFIEAYHLYPPSDET